MFLLDYGKHVMRCFKGIYFLFVPLLCWIPSDACFLVRVEQRWHLQRLFRTQPGSLPICCAWETSLEEGEDWHLFDCIWCLRSYTELPSTCLSVQSPQLFLLLLLLPDPSGVCVTGMWFGSSVIVTQETCKDSGYWLRSSLRQDLNWYLVGALETISKRDGWVTQLHRSVLVSDLKFPFYTPGVHCNFLSSVLPKRALMVQSMDESVSLGFSPAFAHLLSCSLELCTGTLWIHYLYL